MPALLKHVFMKGKMLVCCECDGRVFNCLNFESLMLWMPANAYCRVRERELNEELQNMKMFNRNAGPQNMRDGTSRPNGDVRHSQTVL